MKSLSRRVFSTNMHCATKARRIALSAGLLAAIFSLASGVAVAQDIWTGSSGTSANWSDAANWSSGVPGGWADIAFSSSSTLRLTNNMDLTGGNAYFASLTVTNPSGPVTINNVGGPIWIGNDGINLGAATQNLTINNVSGQLDVQGNGSRPVYPGGNYTTIDACPWWVASGSTLTVSGPVWGTGESNGQTTAVIYASGTVVVGGGSGDTADNNSFQLYAAGGLTQLNKNSGGGDHAVSSITGIDPGATVQLTGQGNYQVHQAGYVNLTGGTFDLNGNSQTGATFNVNNNGSVISFSASGSTFSPNVTNLNSNLTVFTGNGVTGTYNTQITGNGALTTVGSGTLILTGSNTYSGGTTVNGGVLVLQGPAFSTTAGSYSIASGAVLDLDGGAQPAFGTTTISGAGTLRITNGGLGNGAGSGYNINMSLGAGALIDIQAGASLTNGGWSNINWTNNQASLNVNGGTLDIWDGNQVIVDALTGNGTVTHTSYGGTETFEVGVNNGSGNFSGTITDTSGHGLALLKAGSGIQILSGANTYTGGTTISGGTLQLNVGGETGTLASNSNVTVNAGGTLLCNYGDALGWGSGAVNLTVNSGGVVSVTAGNRVTLWNTVNLTGGTITSAAGNGDGTGNYSLNGQLNATSDSSGNAATISATQLGLQNGNTVFNVTRGRGAVDLNVSSVISSWLGGGEGLTVEGNGVTVFSGQNTYAGATAVNGGTLVVDSFNGNYGGAIFIAPGAEMAFNGYGTFGGAISGGGTLANVGSDMILSGPNTVSVMVADAARIFINTPSALTTGTTIINGGRLDFQDGESGTNAASITITGSGGGIASRAGTGPITFSNVTLPGAGSVVFNLDDGETDAFSISSGGVLTGGLTVQVGGNNPVSGAVTLSGNLSGGGSLTVTGPGTLILSGTNTYTGGTDVNDGTLEVLASNAIPYGTGLIVGANGTVEFGNPLGAGPSVVVTSSPAVSHAGSVAAVPEPGTLALLAVAGIVAAVAAWRRKKN